MPNPDEAFACRGSHWTFNAGKFAADLAALKARGSGTFPSFDHALGDPVEGDIEVRPDSTDIVIVEGNYLLQPEGAWLDVKALLDYSYFIRCDVEVLRARLVRRHMQTGVGSDEAAAQHRAAHNDLPNAVDVLTHVVHADCTIDSL
jgi:pantothenate kinase